MAFLLTSCSDQEWLKIPMPDDAMEKYQGHPFSSNSRQSSYVHRARYPDETTITLLGGLLGKEWILCEYGGGVWQDFEDISGNTPKHKYQRLQTWRTKNQKRLLFVALVHETESCVGNNCSPAHTMQRVSIVESKLPWWLFWENFDELCQG